MKPTILPYALMGQFKSAGKLVLTPAALIPPQTRDRDRMAAVSRAAAGTAWKVTSYDWPGYEYQVDLFNASGLDLEGVQALRADETALERRFVCRCCYRTDKKIDNAGVMVWNEHEQPDWRGLGIIVQASMLVHEGWPPDARLDPDTYLVRNRNGHRVSLDAQHGDLIE